MNIHHNDLTDLKKTITSAKKQKEASYFQLLQESSARELQLFSLEEFADHPLFESLIKLTGELQRKKVSYTRFLSRFRTILTHPAYESHKKENSHPLIRFLHALCFASYADPCSIAFYRQIGDRLACMTHEALAEEVPLAQFFALSRKVAKKAGVTDNDYTLQYALKHPKLLISSLQSRYWGRAFSLIKKFDPKGFAGNVPGAFFEEKLLFSDSTITAKTIYSPTPSLGDSIAPEVEAMLQAMENRHFLSSEELQKERYPYLAWSYVNLQNLTHRNERKRSQNLMRLTEKYPHSFRAITVTQDGGLYRYFCGGRYKEKMTEMLLEEANFTTEGGQEGYSFPCRSVEEKEQWKRVLQAIIEISDETVNGGQQVFCELVTLGIVRYFHLLCAKELSQKGLQGAAYLVTAACKESIDRGGKVNALMLLGKGKKDPEVIKASFSCLHARALTVRNRLIKKNRMEECCALLEAVSHDELQQFFLRIDALVSLKGSEVDVLS